MRLCAWRLFWILSPLAISATLVAAGTLSHGSWNGSLRDEAGNPIPEATVRIRLSGGPDYTAQTSANGKFVFADISAGSYELSVEKHQKTWKSSDRLVIKEGTHLTAALQLAAHNKM